MFVLDKVTEILLLASILIFRKLLYAKYHCVITHLSIDGVHHL